MAIPTITALYGSLNAILNIMLAVRVSSARRRLKVSTGMGESKEMELAVRIHANNAEFVPLAIVVLLLARVSHAVGMPLRAPNVYRVFGTVVTWTGIVVSAVYLLWLRTKG